MAPRGPFAPESSKSSTSFAFTPSSRCGGRGSAASDISGHSVRSGKSSRSSQRNSNRSPVENYTHGAGATPYAHNFGTNSSSPRSSVSSGRNEYYAAEGYGGGIDDSSSVRSARGGRSNGSDTDSIAYQSGNPDLAIDSKLMQNGVSFDKTVLRNNSTPSTVSTEPPQPSPSKANSMGALHGYHGIRPAKDTSHRRLFHRSKRHFGKVGPCMRSCVDEVVFGRDMDGSSKIPKDSLHLYHGAAGAFREFSRQCLRSARTMEEHGLEGYAGLQGGSAAPAAKRIWGRVPMEQSMVAEVVFGKSSPNQTLTKREKAAIVQFGHTAGKSPRIRNGEINVKAANMPKTSCYYYPQEKGTMERVVHNSDDRRMPPEVEQNMLQKYHAAAGTSIHIRHEPKTGEAKFSEPQGSSYCVYRTPETKKGTPFLK